MYLVLNGKLADMNTIEMKIPGIVFFKKTHIDEEIEKSISESLKNILRKPIDKIEDSDILDFILNKVKPEFSKVTDEPFEGIIYIYEYMFESKTFSHILDMFSNLNVMLIGIDLSDYTIMSSRIPILIASKNPDECDMIERYINIFKNEFKCYRLDQLTDERFEIVDSMKSRVNNMFSTTKQFTEYMAHLYGIVSGIPTIYRKSDIIIRDLKLKNINLEQNEIIDYMKENLISSTCRMEDTISLSFNLPHGVKICTASNDVSGFWSIQPKGSFGTTLDRHILLPSGETIGELSIEKHARKINTISLIKSLNQVLKESLGYLVEEVNKED